MGVASGRQGRLRPCDCRPRRGEGTIADENAATVCESMRDTPIKLLPVADDSRDVYATQPQKAEVETQKVQESEEVGEHGKDELLAKLQAAHAETELFLRSIPSILIGIDSQGRVTHWNLSATSTFGVEDSGAVGRMIEDCGIRWLHPEIK